MTQLYLDLATFTDVEKLGPPKGYVAFTPRPIPAASEDLLLPSPLRAEVGQTFEIEPSTAEWSWCAEEFTFPQGVLRYISIPDTTSVVNYSSLTDIDPDSLESTTEVKRLWTAVSEEIDTSLEAAQDALDAAVAAGQAANLAEAHAKGLVVTSAVEPDHAEGRIWFDLNDDGGVEAMRQSKNGVWVDYTLVADEILVPGSVGAVSIDDGAITAPKLDVDALNYKSATGMKLSSAEIVGGKYVSPSSVDSSNVTIEEQTFSINREDDEGSVNRTLRLGGQTDDEVTLYNAQGRPVVSLNSDGSGYTTGPFGAPKILLDGEDLGPAIDALPKGPVGIWQLGAASQNAGSTFLGLGEITGAMRPNRWYLITLDLRLVARYPPAIFQVALKYRNANDGLTAHNSYDFSSNIGTIPNSASHDISLVLLRTATVPNQSLGVYIRSLSSTSAVFATYGRMTIIDMGTIVGGATSWGLDHRGGGTPVANNWGRPNPDTDPTPTPPPPPPPTRYVKTYNAIWTASWQGSAEVSSVLGHGYYLSKQRYSQIRMPDAAASDVAGASIKKVEVYLKNEHTWSGSGMTVKIGTSAVSGKYLTTSGTSPSTFSWARNEAKWVTLPTSAWNSTKRSIILGEGAGTSTSGYGKFSNSTSDCRLRITYEK